MTVTRKFYIWTFISYPIFEISQTTKSIYYGDWTKHKDTKIYLKGEMHMDYI